MEEERLLVTKLGGGRIGQGIWTGWGSIYPLSKLKIYNTKIVLSVWPLSGLNLNMGDIKSYSRLTYPWPFGSTIYIDYASPDGDNKNPYTYFFCRDVDDIDKIFKIMAIPKKPLPRPLLGIICLNYITAIATYILIILFIALYLNKVFGIG